MAVRRILSKRPLLRRFRKQEGVREFTNVERINFEWPDELFIYREGKEYGPFTPIKVIEIEEPGLSIEWFYFDHGHMEIPFKTPAAKVIINTDEGVCEVYP